MNEHARRAGFLAFFLSGIWAIGLVAQSAGLRAGMAANILPCVGMLVLAGILCRKKRVKQ